MSRTVLKTHGGKSYLAGRIVGLLPPHLHYVEPFAGGAAVLLAKPPGGASEVINDLNGRLSNFWTVLQDVRSFRRFRRRVEATPFSEVEYDRAGERLDDACPVEAAVAFFVVARQSMAGRGVGFAPLSRRRTRRGMNEQASAWLTAVHGLTAVHVRLRSVVVLCRPALDVLAGQDGPQTCFYCDPPYVHETRESVGQYAHEMTTADHEALLVALTAIQGKFLLSGYHCPLYDDWARQHGWALHEFVVPNAASGEAKKRLMTECVWCNY